MSTPTRTPRPPAPACRPRPSTTIATRRISDAPTTYAPGYAPMSPAPTAAASTRILPKAPRVVVETKPRIPAGVWFGLGALATFAAVYLGFWVWHG